MIDRYVDVEHFGGPFDGQTSRVSPDPDGTLPMLHTIDRYTEVDWSVNPALGSPALPVTHLYKLDSVDRQGVAVQVYRHVGQTKTPVTT